MGIRFACHSCQYALHVKDFQAGRRGKCPECKTVFQIPNADSPTSIPVENAAAAPATDKAPAPTGQQPVHKQQADQPSSNQPSSEQVADQPQASAPSPNAPVAQETVAETAAGETPSPTAAEAPSPAAPVSAAWYLRIADGQQFGPVDEATFMGWLAEGRVTLESFVWRDGWPEWSPATQAFPAHFVSSPPTTPRATTVAPPAAAPPPAPSTQIAPSTVVANHGQASDSRVHAAPTEGVSGLTPIQRARLDKRLKKKRNYQIMLVGLCIAAVLLVCALVVVVMMQSE